MRNKQSWNCPHCPRRKFGGKHALDQHFEMKHGAGPKPPLVAVSGRVKADPDTEPDYSGKCEVCGASPVVPVTGMCGPCTFGEADTIGGNW